MTQAQAVGHLDHVLAYMLDGPPGRQKKADLCGKPNEYPQDGMCRNPNLVQARDFYPTFLQRRHKRFPAG
jgi:hypothetical protein